MGDRSKSPTGNKSESPTNVLLIGTLLIIISIILGIAIKFLIPQYFSLSIFILSLTSQAGVALIIIALVESIYLKKSLKTTSDNIVEGAKHNLDNKFEDTFEVLEHSKSNGLIDILAPRLDEKKGKITRMKMANEVRIANNIDIYCISGADFFRKPFGGIAEGGKAYNALMDRILSMKKPEQTNIRLRVLFLNYNSKSAKIRNEIETTQTRVSNAQDDIEESIKGINELNRVYNKMAKQCKVNKTNLIEYRFYSVSPQEGFLLTENLIYFEPYHFAPTEILRRELKKKKLRATTPKTPCTGGRVPMFHFSPNSNIYVALEVHFNYIWNNPSTTKP